jgi:hypothetical protein
MTPSQFKDRMTKRQLKTLPNGALLRSTGANPDYLLIVGWVGMTRFSDIISVLRSDMGFEGAKWFLSLKRLTQRTYGDFGNTTKRIA